MQHVKFVGYSEKKTQIQMNKTVYLGLPIPELSKTVMYGFWHDYVKPKYGGKAKLIKTDDSYKNIAEDIETGFDASNYELNRPLSKGKKKVIGEMKGELGGKIMKELVGLRAKTHSYLIDDGSKDKKAKATKNVCYKKT